MDEHRDIIGQTPRDKHPGAGEQVGEAVGGTTGALAGAALGSAAGPVGTIVGGIAGALGGWWAGEKVGRAAEDADSHLDTYETHYRKNPSNRVDWDRAKVGYTMGHVAASNPAYRDRPFTEVKSEIREHWNDAEHKWEDMEDYIQHSYHNVAENRDNIL